MAACRKRNAQCAAIQVVLTTQLPCHKTERISIAVRLAVAQRCRRFLSVYAFLQLPLPRIVKRTQEEKSQKLPKANASAARSVLSHALSMPSLERPSKCTLFCLANARGAIFA